MHLQTPTPADAPATHHTPAPPPPPAVIDDAELRALFAGAPHFTLVPVADPELLAEDEYEFEPRVSFPFGGAPDAGETDWRAPGHPSLAFCTSRGSPDEAALVREVPAMHAFTGTEPGTVGWEYFLMLPVGDAEREVEDEDDDLDEGGRERGGGLREIRGGVRSVELGYIVQRLKELGNIWQATTKRRRRREGTEQSDDDDEDAPEEQSGPSGQGKLVDMYTHLFTHLLFPPTRITTEEYHDPYSLKVQIMALIQTLSNKVWLDFGSVRWRIKLGQILWGNVGQGEDGEYDEYEASQKESERVLLLLQILLAAELLVRLDLVLQDASDQEQRRGSVQSDQSLPESKENILHRIREAGGAKVQIGRAHV